MSSNEPVLEHTQLEKTEEAPVTTPTNITTTEDTSAETANAAAPSSGRRASFAPPPVEFTPENCKQCLKQVEFYFSESNYPYDRFLRTIAEENDGWVPISTIATFNRMKKYRPMDKVVEILKTSEILQVSEDGENIKRRVPLDLSRGKEARLEQNKRTLAIMNIPHEEETGSAGAAAGNANSGRPALRDTALLQEKLEKFFGGLAEINQVRLVRVNRKRFNGTAFVEFKTQDECDKFLKNYSSGSVVTPSGSDSGDGTADAANKVNEDAEAKDILSFEGHRLSIMTKKQYNMQREATRSKNFGGSGQRSRSFTGHRKNMPKISNTAVSAEGESAVAIEEESESAVQEDKEQASEKTESVEKAE